MFQFPASIHKSRRRRQIRLKLDDVSRIMNLHFRGAVADCALISAEGEVMTAKGVSPRPFVALAPKVAAVRRSASALASALAVTPSSVLHLRGSTWLVAIHALGPHALVAYAPVSLDTSEDHLSAMNRVLRAEDIDSASGPIADLGNLVKEIW